MVGVVKTMAELAEWGGELWVFARGRFVGWDGNTYREMGVG